MFKNSDDEQRFERALITFRQEFGAENLIIFLPRREANSINKDLIYEPMTITFWKKNLYAIRVRELTANFEMPPTE